MTKQLTLFILILALASAPTTAAIYKHFDENGNVVYSDVPDKLSTKPHKPKAITTFSSKNNNSQRVREGESDFDGESSTQSGSTVITYQEFTISSPADGATIRANSGSLSIQLSLSPALSVENNHKIIVTMDGSARQESTGTSVTFENVDRGAHSFSAEIVDDTDAVISSASPVSIQVLRHSVLHKKAAN